MNKKLSKMQLILMSTGGMIGSGWLFSPFYGYQTAGIGVLYSWGIVALITLIIGLSFAQICATFPIVGGIYRFMSLTHPKSMASTFLILGWLSYVVYLPLEAQAVVQYLGFWVPSLLVSVSNHVELSWRGIALAMFIIFGITGFNTLLITRVASVNSVVSFWKIVIPIAVALIVIFSFGHFNTLTSVQNKVHFSFENVLLAITSSGLAFAFSGFQNGLILANQVKEPGKALPYSLFAPILVGLVLYALLSLSYLLCLDGQHQLSLTGTAAPLLALVALFGLNWLFTILFIDAILAPLGTTNVYIAVTSRILYSVGKELSPNSALTKVNKQGAPVFALWINAVIGVIFLFPFPTWKELVNFLSSIVVFAYLAGPVSVLVLHKKQPQLLYKFKLPCPNLIGYLGFICCTWLIYWSGFTNLVYLFITLAIIIAGYYAFNSKAENFKTTMAKNWYLIVYLASLTLVSFLRSKQLIPFPMDNLIIAAIGLVFCCIFTRNSLPFELLEENLVKTRKELALE